MHSEEAVILQFPVMIKSFGHEGARRFSVEASCEEEDSEGDRILQKALLDAKEEFLKSGTVDWNHWSEVGLRMGLKNPDFYIIGRPTEVIDLGKGRTAVSGELFRAKDGSFNPESNMADRVWEMLNREPPIPLYASIYGFARDFEEAGPHATRYLVKGFRWKSLALTRNPVNSNLKGKTEIVTAKAYINETIKGGEVPEQVVMAGPYRPLRDREDMWGDYDLHCRRTCPETKNGSDISIFTLRNHYMTCRGLDYGTADLMAHAAMHLSRRMRERRYKRRV